MTRRVTYRPHRSLFVIAAIFLFGTTGCNQDGAQDEFLRQALMPPSGITYVEFGGETGDVDPDDWRVSPFFDFIIEISPAIPNPALTSDQITIDMEITGTEPVNGLYLYVYRDNGNILTPIGQEIPGSIESGLVSFVFNAFELAQFESSSAVGEHRVILYDGQNNIISYGDIRVE